MQPSSFSSAHYLSKGLYLVRQKGIRQFVIIPLLINLILLTVAAIFAFDYLSSWYESLNQSDYSIVQWFVTHLGWLLWPLIVIGVFVVIFFAFALLANWIAAPFNGLLSEAVERHLSGSAQTSPPFSWRQFTSEIPRLMGREWTKLAYYLPRALACLLLFFVIGPLAPIIWFVFNAWMTAIQYVDFGNDNHQKPFADTLNQVRSHKSGAFGFGALVLLFTMVPVINLLIMPVAVAGGTALWFERLKN